MANENETVSQVCEKIASVAKEMHETDYGEVWSMAYEIERCNDEILAAHTRDLADFQRRYDECVRKFNEVDLERVRLRDEVAAKDAEIASLHETIKRLEHENSVLFIDVDYLRALVKDLADVAERFVSCKATECETVCGVDAKCIHKKAIALVARAREACK